MIECKRCGCKHSKVTNSYRKDGRYRGKQITVIRRRRSCRFCGYCWFTTEHFEDLDDWKESKLIVPRDKPVEEKPEPNDKLNKDPKGKNPYLPED